jgi:CRP/FNR family cyclic AMP-dependent transcriptional regulator
MNPLPGRIIEIHNEESNRIGLVEFNGKRRAIYLSLVQEAQVGDDVLFHAGFAIELVKSGEAQADRENVAGGGQQETKPDLENCGAYRLLSRLDPDQLRKLIPIAQDKQFAAGQIIFPAGAKSSFLHLIVSGDVGLEASAGDRTVEVQTLHAGDAMGWSAFTGGGLTHFQARALSPVFTIAFPGDQLRAACDADPALGYALMKRLMELATERLDAMRMKLAERPGDQITDR